MAFNKTIVSKPRNFPTKTLMVLLPLIMIGITYVIATVGQTAGYMVIVAAIGLVVAAIAIMFPQVGFYFSIIFSFFLFDIQRFLMTDVPLGLFVDLLVYITFVGVILRKIQRNERFWKDCYHPIVFIYIIVFLYSLMELFNPMGAPLSITLPLFRRFVSLMIFFYCCIQLFEDRESIVRFIKVFFVFALIAALYGCYQEWFGYPAYEMRSIQSNPHGERLLSLGGGKYRKFSFFASPTDFGILMSACAVMMLIFLINIKMIFQKRILVFLGMALMALAMSYSGTRTATMVLVLEVLLYIIMTLSNRRTLVFAALFAALFVFIVYGPIYGNTTVNRIRSTFDLSDDDSYQVRDENRKSIQPFIYSHPLGGGMATSGFNSGQYVPDHPLAGFPSDSGLLKHAIEYGWLGMIVLYITYIIGLQQGIRAYYRSRNRHNKTLFLAAVIGLFGYIVAQYAQIAVGMIPGAFLFYALLAMIIRLRQIEQFEPDQTTKP
jgi:putative inorganic carbon (hco3(-)) transporter